ncbi:MAG: SCO family protein [Proteobacteria bacterium]|nr:SCO family protein [Pseudomonadota bacterium]
MRRCSPTTTLWPSFVRVLAAVVAAAALLAGCDGGGPKFKNTDITGADYAKGFALTDHTGKPRTLEDFRGKVVVVFFGYTHCPDVCPTTLAELKQVMQAIGPDADKVQVVFITLDPERDTQQVLAQYVPAFDPRFLGMYADAATTMKTAKDFKVFYEKRAGTSPGSYTIDHTAASFAFDPQGRLRLYVKTDSVGTLVDDIRTLLKG